MELRRHAVLGMALLGGLVLATACGSTSSPTSSSSSGATNPTVAATPNLTCPVAAVANTGAANTAPGSGTPASAAAITTGTATGTLTEDGSSLIYPYLEGLVAPFAAANPGLSLSPASGGSGKGQSDAIAGNVDMGGSDAYLSSSQVSANPGLLNIPIAVSAQAVNYNLPGLTLPAGQTGLKLSGCILANMYMGKITTWNDPSIAALNPGVTLPSTAVVPVHRVDSSGDTFIFTSLLSDTNSAWAAGPSFGTTVTWPAASQLTGNGNPDMVNKCAATKGCVAYIGVSVEQSALTDGLGEVELQNASGNYVLPTPANMTAAVTAGGGSVPNDLTQSLIYETGADSYPIVNFEYLIVKSKQSSANTAAAIRDFYAWAVSTTGGSTGALLATVGFIALPTNVLPKVYAAVNSIT